MQKIVATFVLLVIAISFALSLPIHQNALEQSIAAQYGRLPLYFIKNQGIYPPEVLFYARTKNNTVFFTSDSLVFTTTIDMRRISWKLDFGNAGSATICGLREQYCRVHYFKGNDPKKWQRNIPTFAAIRYREIYPGVDLCYYSKDGKLKYEYIVKPGAKVARIKLQWKNVRSLAVADNGDLLIDTAAGMFRDTRPVSYQTIDGERVPVVVNFDVESNGKYRFVVEAYNPKYELVIDPLTYSTFLGGTDDDFGYALVVDDNRNVYITGRTLSADFPTTLNAYDVTFNGDMDVFVSKLNLDGFGLVYSSFLGGASSDYSRSIALDYSGRAVIAGHTFSEGYPTTQAAYDTSHNGGSDVFVSKLTADGSDIVYSTFLGAQEWDSAYAIVLDSSDDVCITGETDSTQFPTTEGAYDTTHNGNSDVFVSHLFSDGSALIYSTFLGGEDSDIGYDIAVDANQQVVITGVAASGYPTTAGAYDTSHNGDSDVFVSALNADGTALVYSTFLGGEYSDAGYAIALDHMGNAWITGETLSADFPFISGSYDTSHNGWYDAFVAKVSADGANLMNATFLGHDSWDSGGGIALDPHGNVYIAGKTQSADFPTTSGAFDNSHNGGSDLFVSKLTADCSKVVYSTFLGGEYDEYHWYGDMLAVDTSGNAYMTGWSKSGDFPTTNGAHSQTHNGGDDVVVSKIAINSPAEIAIDFGSSLGLFVYKQAPTLATNSVNAFSKWNRPQIVHIEQPSPPDLPEFTAHNVEIDTSGPALPNFVAKDVSATIVIQSYGYTQISSDNPTHITYADIDGDGRPELIASYPNQGLYIHYYDGSKTLLHSVVPNYFTAIDLDGDDADELAITFQQYGFYIYKKSDNSWTRIHSLLPSYFTAVDFNGDNKEELAINFSQLGLYTYEDSNIWIRRHSVLPVYYTRLNLQGNGREQLAISFQQFGLYLYDGAIWTRLHSLIPEYFCQVDIDGDGKDELAVSFDYTSPHGLYTYKGDGSWAYFHSWLPLTFVNCDLDSDGKQELAVVLDSYGLYTYEDDTGWAQLHTQVPENLATWMR